MTVCVHVKAAHMLRQHTVCLITFPHSIGAGRGRPLAHSCNFENMALPERSRTCRSLSKRPLTTAAPDSSPFWLCKSAFAYVCLTLAFVGPLLTLPLSFSACSGSAECITRPGGCFCGPGLFGDMSNMLKGCGLLGLSVIKPCPSASRRSATPGLD